MEFKKSATWTGVMQGYYFGTHKGETGYYIDTMASNLNADNSLPSGFQWEFRE